MEGQIDLNKQLRENLSRHDTEIDKEIEKLARSKYGSKRVKILVVLNRNHSNGNYKPSQAHLACFDANKGIQHCAKAINPALANVSTFFATVYIVLRRKYIVPADFMTDYGNHPRNRTSFEDWYGLEPVDGLFQGFMSVNGLKIEYRDHDDCYFASRE
jgi:hypothetical protein